MRASSLGQPWEPIVSTARRLSAATAALTLTCAPLPALAAPTDPPAPAQVFDTAQDLRVPDEARELARASRARRQVTPSPPDKAVMRVPVAPSQPSAPPRTERRAVKPAPPPAAGSAAAVVAFALAQVGKPYVWGAAGPSSFDCSGLTLAAYARAGIGLPHQSGAQATFGRAVNRTQLQPGDLVVYAGHVGIAVGGGRMVHAANPRKGVMLAPIYGTPGGYRRLIG